VLAVGSEQIEGSGIAETRRIKVAAVRFVVEKFDDDFFVSRGWSARFHVGEPSGEQDSSERKSELRNLWLSREFGLSAWVAKERCRNGAEVQKVV